MKAIVQDRYGPPDVLELRDLPEPTIGDDQVLVRVVAASIHPGDWLLMRGRPAVMRLGTGLRQPRKRIPGFDLAGRVEAVGSNVTRFRPGDEVFGTAKGSCAELVATSPSTLAPRPVTLELERSAALPISGVTALRAIRDVGKVRPGHRVLINGASGGVGTFAVQIAKALGAEVTGVCGASHLETVRAIGADHVIDYAYGDFTAGPERYDLILDNVGDRPLAEMRRALSPTGTLLPNNGTRGGPLFGTLGRLLRASVASLFIRGQGRPFLATETEADLLALKQLIERGELAPVIGRTFPMQEAREAMSVVGEGHAGGKVLLVV